MPVGRNYIDELMDIHYPMEQFITFIKLFSHLQMSMSHARDSEIAQNWDLSKNIQRKWNNSERHNSEKWNCTPFFCKVLKSVNKSPHNCGHDLLMISTTTFTTASFKYDGSSKLV